MFIKHENDEEYRFGDSGPKYLMKGPRSNFALVQFQPGQEFQAHYHQIMEENFFILNGKVDIVVDGEIHTLSAGQLIHIDPMEVHYVANPYEEPVKMISTLAPYQIQDKTDVENPPYDRLKK
ncbi:MAG: cupin domain-containing protein [Lachnospiraceae bacterium]|nr:cupin domain-containing protein [Lachnospiraceae bacterium]